MAFLACRRRFFSPSSRLINLWLVILALLFWRRYFWVFESAAMFRQLKFRQLNFHGRAVMFRRVFCRGFCSGPAGHFFQTFFPKYFSQIFFQKHFRPGMTRPAADLAGSV
jgi:hypothetical protein